METWKRLIDTGKGRTYLKKPVRVWEGMMNAGNSSDSKIFKTNKDRDRNMEIEGGRE